MFAPSLRCESWRGILSPVDSTKGGWIERRMGGLNDEQEGQGKREENGGVGYKKRWPKPPWKV